MQKLPPFAKPAWSWPNSCWNILCIASIIGIWPRFIEPRRIREKKLHIKIKDLPPHLEGFKIVLFSDLHLQPSTSPRYLKKLQKKIIAARGDIVVLTGDLLCQGSLLSPDKLLQFLEPLKGKLGSFAVLGNHDYEQYIGANIEGSYCVKVNQELPIKEAFKRLFFSRVPLTGKMDPSLKGIKPHQDLLKLLGKTPFKLLRNASFDLNGLTVVGLGEYSANDMDMPKAFQNIQGPTLVLCHNPDAAPHINYPFDLMLSGHTHGGQFNLPILWKKFTLIENDRFKSGLIDTGGKALFVSRGVGSVLPLRLFSPPEINTITLGKR